jgi:starch synthase
MHPSRILLAVSEAHPLIKTGGLGDAVVSLAVALRDAGLDARLVIPAYRDTMERVEGIRVIGRLPMPGNGQPAVLRLGQIPDTEVPVYLVDAPGLFDRPGGPYTDPSGADWPDNAERFAMFGRAIAALAVGSGGAGWRPHILHCNDWHTGLAPALLATNRLRPAVIYQIHTLAYQGLFPFKTFQRLKLPMRLWSPEALEFHDQMSFIKGGLVFADRLITVSPSYAREILTPELGYGLEGLLQHRREQLYGILNGVNYDVWDPRQDAHIARHYWIDSLPDKRINKRELQTELGLPQSDSAFLVASIGRLTEQKGTDLILDALPRLLKRPDLQMVFLGTGAASLEKRLQRAGDDYSGKLAVHIGYSEALAHRIEAAADAFLMPSRFEPCGLNQLYSLRYGTIPIVSATGGLADTVVDPLGNRDKSRTATGFVFEDPAMLVDTVARAASLFKTEPRAWRRLMINGMEQDFSWSRSVVRYRAVYEEAANDITRLRGVGVTASN